MNAKMVGWMEVGDREIGRKRIQNGDQEAGG
jgi:hypothetical protein